MRWLGEVPDDELARLYRGARCVAYVSLYEGFGLPVLEAMACGAPVVAGRSDALEEVSGGAAVLVDPLDPDAIAAGLNEAIDRSEELRPLGLERARASTGARSRGRRSPCTAKRPREHSPRRARRRRARPAAHRRRDLRPLAAAGARPRCAGRPAARGDHATARPRPRADRAPRASGAEPDRAHGPRRAAPASPRPPRARALHPRAPACLPVPGRA